MKYMEKTGEKVVYFANFIDKIAELITYLLAQGVPADELGYSFNYEEKHKEKFPKEIADTLESKINDMNVALTTVEMVPENIKILFTTSKIRKVLIF